MNSSSRPGMDIENSGVIPNISECLTFSPAFSLTGFETMNDTVLKEMNERARNQLQNQQPQHNLPDVHSSLQKYAQITKAPPDNRYTAAHTRQFAHQPSITDIPKRTGTGEESPSKRRRAPTGEVLGIMSPVKGLADLSIDDQARIAKTKAARYKRELQLSPRRRQQQQQKRGIPTPTPRLGDDVPKLETAPMPRFPSLQTTPKLEPRKLFTGTPTRQTPPHAPNTSPLMPRSTSIRSGVRTTSGSSTSSGPSGPSSGSSSGTSSGASSSGSAGSGSGSASTSNTPGTPSMVRSSSTNTIRPSRPPVRNRVVSQPTPSPTHSGPTPRPPTSRPLPSRPLPTRPLSRPTISQSSSSRSLRIPQVDENLPHYARPTQATLRRSQSSQIHRPNS